MRHSVITLAAIQLSLFAMMQASGLLGIAMPLSLFSAEVEVSSIGWVMAFYSTGLMLGSLYGKRIISQVGHIRSFAGFAALAAMVAITLNMTFDLPLWAGLRFLTGFSAAVMLIAVESWMTGLATNANRGRLLALHQITFYLAMGSGQLSINLTTGEYSQGYLIAALLFCFAVMPMVLVRTINPVLTPTEQINIMPICRKVPASVAGTLGAGCAIGALYNLVPVYARANGLTTFDTSLLMGALVFGGVLLQYPVGRITERCGNSWPVLILLLLLCLLNTVAAILPMPHSMPVLLSFAALLGSILACLYPACVVAASARIEPQERVTLSSTLLVFYAVGGFTAPVLASQLMHYGGSQGVFIFTALAQGGIALFIFFRVIRRH
ncbi:MAG: MFS transporter [Marinobacterium sp.]|nr:MFS transporter [Marinobacterium sp.]